MHDNDTEDPIDPTAVPQDVEDAVMAQVHALLVAYRQAVADILLRNGAEGPTGARDEEPRLLDQVRPAKRYDEVPGWNGPLTFESTPYTEEGLKTKAVFDAMSGRGDGTYLTADGAEVPACVEYAVGVDHGNGPDFGAEVLVRRSDDVVMVIGEPDFRDTRLFDLLQAMHGRPTPEVAQTNTIADLSMTDAEAARRFGRVDDAHEALGKQIESMSMNFPEARPMNRKQRRDHARRSR